MKKQIVVALALLVSTLSFSQKNELKTAEKAIKSGNFADAKSAIKSAEALIVSADDKTKAKFYFLKGETLYANGTGSNTDMDLAIENFAKVKDIESKTGKAKYTGLIYELTQAMLSNFLTKANKALEEKNYLVSSSGFEKAYRMSPKDTLYLYYAASTAVTAQDYDKSLELYEELKGLGYQGSEVKYSAVNKDSGETENFDNQQLRDFSVKSGTHIAPKETKTKSKAAEIIKNIALIYVNKGDNEKAISAIGEARVQNPDDLSLLMTEANVQLKMGNTSEFKKLIEEATKKDPNNAELQYNLGVVAADAGENQAARDYYKKAISLNPDYADAYNNMAVLVLSGEQKIIEEMNGLGSSAADDKRYDELKEERLVLYREAVTYLNKTLELKPKNIDVAKTLLNIYRVLGDTDKANSIKAKIEALESGN
ncbi:tetratricopeptide repeat protein [Ichthyenterobacterium magnum]|uniref:Tetratricopeptide repeat protein n=1 Tax=Ichthyenterobacterium magnum TaxID=1230530 RepID=A0A420DMN9_9FLAO|nr:tetratricopeptide repeat protein [Ichthyenterobacterium magnum]RKE95447.1 tetratricopeptide repeat protein [Ichthyenterobacterium magnum]